MQNIFLLYFVLFAAFVPAQHDTAHQHRPDSAHRHIKNLHIPKTYHGDHIIHHLGYSLLYNEKHEQANWVAYELTREELDKKFPRCNKFKPDPDVITASAEDADYKKSGYDRGHLAPAADMGWSEAAMQESFYFSNMSPQNPSFNRGIWKNLEEQVREWALTSGTVNVVTGPLLIDGLPFIGPNKVSVPQMFYKVVLVRNEKESKGLGFIIPNRSSKDSLQFFATSIDNVEAFTGIDFFPSLPDEEEGRVESTVCLECWKWRLIRKKKK